MTPTEEAAVELIGKLGSEFKTAAGRTVEDYGTKMLMASDLPDGVRSYLRHVSGITLATLVALSVQGWISFEPKAFKTDEEKAKNGDSELEDPDVPGGYL